MNKKTHKLIVLRFLVETNVNFYVDNWTKV